MSVSSRCLWRTFGVVVPFLTAGCGGPAGEPPLDAGLSSDAPSPEASSPDAGSSPDATASPDAASSPDATDGKVEPPATCSTEPVMVGTAQMFNLRRAAAGDLNRDGRVDLVAIAGPCGCTTPVPPNEVVVFEAGEDGQLLPKSKIVSDPPTAVALGDLNGDGKLDAVVGTSSGVSIALYEENGFGTVQTVSSAFSGDALVIADFNEDKHLDIVVVGRSGGWPFMQVLFGKGDGTFAASVPRDNSVPLDLAAIDFDGDGHLDLATVGYDSIAWFKGDGVGNLAAPIDLWRGRVESLAVGDIDGDGLSDIVGRTLNSLVLVAGPNRAAPTVTVESQVASGLALSDVDRDGHLDLVTSRKYQGYSGFVDIRFGDGAGHFKPAFTLDVNAGIDLVIPVDTNHDGKTDFALSGWFSTGRPYFNVMKAPCQ